MNKINKYVVRCAVATAVLLLVPFESWASDEKKTQSSDSSSFGELATSLGEWAAQSSHYSLDMLGITEMECNCTFTYGEDEESWSFQAEPEIKGVDRDGPSHGKLKEGDVIVAIDGMLITTRKAGIRFANLVAGEPVELIVRRWRRTRTVTIVPREVLKRAIPLELSVNSYDLGKTLTIEPGTPIVPNLARSIEELSRSAVEIGELVGELGVTPASEFGSFPEFNINFGEMFPEGWVGFGLSFSGSIKHKDEDKPAEWRFNDPPTIKSVQPGSPADKAGFQVGDELLEIDGSKLDSRKGGKRFSRMLPGQLVEWKVRRAGKTFYLGTTAEERPEPDLALAVPFVPTPPDSQPVSYTGTVAGVEVEVRGGGDVSIEVDEETGDIIIRTRDSVVRVKAKEKK
jgi:hypothetical protein